MITFCSKCKINWATLHSQDAEGDETYEFCPLCRSTEFLEDGNDITAFIMNPITGEIVDADTGYAFNLRYLKLPKDKAGNMGGKGRYGI